MQDAPHRAGAQDTTTRALRLQSKPMTSKMGPSDRSEE